MKEELPKWLVFLETMIEKIPPGIGLLLVLVFSWAFVLLFAWLLMWLGSLIC
jgi:hypothetical protein